MIAALPMYDLPGLEAHNDRLWRAIADRLRAAGVDAPGRLQRETPLADVWTAPDLLLAQTCGYPLVKQLAGRVRVVATPRYRARGCEGSDHRALIIARADDDRDGLEPFRGAVCALNDPGSNTGMNLLRAEIAPLVRSGETAFFGGVTVTGSHSASIDAVISGDADIAAVDCVTHALLRRLNPARLAKVRVVASTTRTSCLPLITAASTPGDVVVALKEALDAVARDPDLKPTLDALLIEGFARVPIIHYRAVLRVEQIAVELGYPMLR